MDSFEETNPTKTAFSIFVWAGRRKPASYIFHGWGINALTITGRLRRERNKREKEEEEEAAFEGE